MKKVVFFKSWAKLHNCMHIANTAYAVQLKFGQIHEKRRRRNRWKEEHYSTNPFFCALLNSLELYLWDGYLIGKKAEIYFYKAVHKIGPGLQVTYKQYPLQKSLQKSEQKYYWNLNKNYNKNPNENTIKNSFIIIFQKVSFYFRIHISNIHFCALIF